MIKQAITHWKSVLYTLLGIICLAGLAVLMSFISRKSRDYVCKEVHIVLPGEQSFIARSDIDTILRQQYGDLVGKTLSALPIHDMEHVLGAIPFIKKAEITADMDGTLVIQMEQRTALLRIINRTGEQYYLDEAGIKMPISPYYTPRVLVANGMIDEPFQQLDSIRTPIVTALYETAAYLRSDTLWDHQIEQLYVNAAGEIEMIPRIGDQTIILGNADSLETKFDKLYLFYKEVIPAVGWDYYKTVKLNFSGQLVCEKNKKYINEKPQ